MYLNVLRKPANPGHVGTGQMYLAGTGASGALRCDAKCVKVLRNARKSTRIMCFLVDDLGVIFLWYLSFSSTVQ